MRTDFQRSGGFAGMRLAISVDTDTLPASEARDLEQLVETSQFFALPSTLKVAAGADQFNYKLTIEEGHRRHSVEVSESAAPASLRPLLDHMITLARAVRGRAADQN